MSQEMPQIKNQALRFVTFLVGTLSLIFLLIVIVIFSKFYTFKDAVSKKEQTLSALYQLEKYAFDVINSDLSVESKQQLDARFLKVILSLRNFDNQKNMAYLISDLGNSWEQFKRDEISSRQYFNKARNVLLRLNEITEEDFVRFSLNYTNTQKIIIFYSVLVFLFSAILLWIISKRWLERLSTPIVTVANELVKTGNLNSPLNLPPANYLELDQLNKTLMDVWDDLRNLDYAKVKEIKVKNLKLQSILMSIDDIVFVIDADDRLVQANEEFFKEFALDHSSINMKWSKLKISSKVKDLLEGIDAKNTTKHLDGIVEVCIEESRKTFSARKRLVIDEEDGTFYGIIYMLEDITEEIEQQKVQKEFVAVLSHELKTPIQSLTTASELLSDFQKEIHIPEYEILTNAVSEDIRKVKAIADDFVRFSKSDISTFNMNQSKRNLSKEIMSILEPLRLLIADKKISIKVSQEDDQNYLVYLDSTKFAWALSNIVLNAYRVSPERSQINIKLKKIEDKVEVKVIDQGIGIAEEEQKVIFKPFFQGKRRGSFGLGLAIAKQVIDAHDGSLTYMNNEPCGAIFVIKLPLMEALNA